MTYHQPKNCYQCLEYPTTCHDGVQPNYHSCQNCHLVVCQLHMVSCGGSCQKKICEDCYLNQQSYWFPLISPFYQEKKLFCLNCAPNAITSNLCGLDLPTALAIFEKFGGPEGLLNAAQSDPKEVDYCSNCHQPYDQKELAPCDNKCGKSYCMICCQKSYQGKEESCIFDMTGDGEIYFCQDCVTINSRPCSSCQHLVSQYLLSPCDKGCGKSYCTRCFEEQEDQQKWCLFDIKNNGESYFCQDCATDQLQESFGNDLKYLIRQFEAKNGPGSFFSKDAKLLDQVDF